METVNIPRVAILASGSGTTVQAYAEAIYGGLVKHEIGLVVSSRESAGILEKAAGWNKNFGFNALSVVINGQTHKHGAQPRGQTLEESKAIADLAAEQGCGLIACLGYMRIISGDLMERFGYLPGQHTSPYQARMINSHPGPLPLTNDTYGEGAASVALAAYRRGKINKSAHTVHVVAPGVDRGPIIAVYDVPIQPGDTKQSLNERTQQVEKANIAYAIDTFLRNQQEYLREAKGGKQLAG